MIAQQNFGLDWNDLRSRVKRQWGLLTDGDFNEAGQNIQKLIGIVQLRTGRARDEVEHFLKGAVSDASSGLGQAAAAFRDYSSQASEALQRGYESAEEQVKREPMKATLLAIGAGLLIGVALGGLFRRS